MRREENEINRLTKPFRVPSDERVVGVERFMTIMLRIAAPHRIHTEFPLFGIQGSGFCTNTCDALVDVSGGEKMVRRIRGLEIEISSKDKRFGSMREALNVLRGEAGVDRHDSLVLMEAGHVVGPNQERRQRRWWKRRTRRSWSLGQLQSYHEVWTSIDFIPNGGKTGVEWIDVQ
jgi:hypothetical protein